MMGDIFRHGVLPKTYSGRNGQWKKTKKKDHDWHEPNYRRPKVQFCPCQEAQRYKNGNFCKPIVRGWKPKGGEEEEETK